MQIFFINEFDFTVIYTRDDIQFDEDGILSFFKLIGEKLRKIYHYVFSGSYQVNIYQKNTFLILDFLNVSSYGKIDFDVTLFTNSVLLYEFYDFDYVLTEKIFYDGNYYVELEMVSDKLDFLEMGRIVYGKEVESVLEKGKLLSHSCD